VQQIVSEFGLGSILVPRRGDLSTTGTWYNTHTDRLVLWCAGSLVGGGGETHTHTRTQTQAHRHTPYPPGSVCEAALFRDMAAKSLEEVGLPSVKYRRQGRTGLPAAKKERRKLQVFNLAASGWGLPRAGMAHTSMCFAT
jgi:hypothetical protein